MELYDQRTVQYYQNTWTAICDMSFLNRQVTDEILMIPNDGSYFTRHEFPDEITLDYMWEFYSRKYRNCGIVPELKRLHVPRELFMCLGVQKWFEYSFPNCLVTFW